MFTDVEYIKQDGHCNNHKYGSFQNVQDAKDACSNDNSCKGVYDSGCDNGRGGQRIYLCELGYEYKTSSSSCIYDKSGVISKIYIHYPQSLTNMTL